MYVQLKCDQIMEIDGHTLWSHHELQLKRDQKNKRVPRKAGLAGLKSLRALTDREKKRDKTIGS